jgi:hypothetical protein
MTTAKYAIATHLVAWNARQARLTANMVIKNEINADSFHFPIDETTITKNFGYWSEFSCTLLCERKSRFFS